MAFDRRVLVLGAGVAGLAAADALAVAGRRVTVIEARDRVGGRIETRRDFAAAAIECGAEFVHGRHPSLVRLVEESGLALYPRPFAPLGLEKGRDLSLPSSWDKVFAEIARADASDRPIGERARELRASGEWSEAEERRLRAYVAGYMAGDPDRLSAKALSDETRAADALGDDGNASIREGYDALVAAMVQRLRSHGVELLLSSPVRQVEWSRGSVRVHADGVAQPLDAPAAIVTVPLGILQLAPEHDDAIRFTPPIDRTLAAARRLAMGNVVKIFLALGRPLSALGGIPAGLRAKLDAASFYSIPSATVPTFWCSGQRERPVMVGWTGGPIADRLSGKGESAIVDEAVASLAGGLGIDAARLRAELRHAAVADWQQDRWSHGAYSWIPAGALDAPAALAAPVDDTLFFAGEATDVAGYRGTVHGALESATRAVRELLGADASGTPSQRRAG